MEIKNIQAPRHWLLLGDSPVTGEFTAQRASYAEMFPFDDVIIHLPGTEAFHQIYDMAII